MLSTPAAHTHKRPIILIRVCLMTTYNSMGIYYQSLNTRSYARLIGLISVINRKTKFVAVFIVNKKSCNQWFCHCIHSTIKLPKRLRIAGMNCIMHSTMNLKWCHTHSLCLIRCGTMENTKIGWVEINVVLASQKPTHVHGITYNKLTATHCFFFPPFYYVSC